MNIAKKDLLAIEVDFLARALEHMLHAIATMQNIPHTRSSQVHMSDLDRATVRLHASWTHPSCHAPKVSSENPAVALGNKWVVT